MKFRRQPILESTLGYYPRERLTKEFHAFFFFYSLFLFVIPNLIGNPGVGALNVKSPRQFKRHKRLSVNITLGVFAPGFPFSRE